MAKKKIETRKTRRPSVKSPDHDLVIVAHPDDETLFFGGLILSEKKRPWQIICVTDANADGHGSERAEQFRKACKRLGAEHAEFWHFTDQYDVRLDQEKLVAALKGLPPATRIFTHSILGEYGHPHHQDVAAAVHRAFSNHRNLFSVAYNAYPDFLVDLSKKDYEIKCEILSRIYHTETQRFAFLLPSTFAEGFLKVSPREAAAVYEMLTNEKHQVTARQLKVYRWFHGNLDRLGGRVMPRLF